jgi:hypothetical protein
MNSYELSRYFFNWCYENPEKISPNHIALYFFCIEHCNRLGWKEKFGLPTTMAKEAIGIKSYNTYVKTLNDLIDYGFIIIIEKSKNQYSTNIIALSKINKALDKALDKALTKHVTKHVTKQCESTGESICSIDKPITNNQITNKQITQEWQKNISVSIFFESLQNGSELETICSANSITVEKAKEKLKEFRKHSEIEYPSYAKFVWHFKSWLVKNLKLTQEQAGDKKTTAKAPFNFGLNKTQRLG